MRYIKHYFPRFSFTHISFARDRGHPHKWTRSTYAKKSATANNRICPFFYGNFLFFVCNIEIYNVRNSVCLKILLFYGLFNGTSVEKNWKTTKTRSNVCLGYQITALNGFDLIWFGRFHFNILAVNEKKKNLLNVSLGCI